MNPAVEFVKIIAARLDAGRIPYMLTGSMAMSLYSIARATRDIDLVVELKEADTDAIVGLFEKDCYIDADSVRDAIKRQSMFNIIHNKSVVKADFIVRKDKTYRRMEFERRRSMSYYGALINVVAPEDLVLSKLAWAKRSESEFQLRDVRTILAEIPEIDWSYLHEWAEQIGVRELLDEAKPNA